MIMPKYFLLAFLSIYPEYCGDTMVLNDEQHVTLKITRYKIDISNNIRNIVFKNKVLPWYTPKSW